MFKKIFSLLSLALFVHTAVFSQEVAPAATTPALLDYLVWSLAVVVMFLLAVVLILVFGFIKLTSEQNNDQSGVQESFISRLFKSVGQSLNESVPIEREKEIEFAHQYDGIRELDNSLPPWWKYMFYLSMVFAVVYLYRYHISGSAPLSIDEYNQEMAEATIQKGAFLAKAANLVDETSVVAMTDKSDLENGSKTFESLCVACHGTLGEGKATLGPNLTDEYWIHGGNIKDIFKTIKYGVQGKAMISWQDQISPKQMQEVSSYVLLLQGTNPPNAKEPEGAKYVPEGTPL
ncbi:MAG: cbb3-type cytochrome c oxidase N-terminal domain-containing protein [Chitinophagales bacterium]|nr:cbb3-type cytochrome c oxidase N-terminal domain-containing protein [Chitinophagales bacterium]